MPDLADCQSLLRLLIARGDPRAIPLAMGAIDQYLDTAPVSARGRGLRVLQRDALGQHGAAVGVQRSFAETVDMPIVLVPLGWIRIARPSRAPWSCRR